ncbi:MAG: hypothetical protein ACM34O_09710 [Ignavibacteria bacterium]
MCALFFHNFDKNRSAKADSLFFNEVVSMKKVVPISNESGSIAFLDTLNEFEGGKMILIPQMHWYDTTMLIPEVRAL